MTPEDNNVARLLGMIENASQASRFRNYDSDNFDNYDSEAYTGIYSPVGLQGNAQGITPDNLTTYDMLIKYTPVAVVPAPVDISLFEALYNPGVFEGNNLLFTNAGGDQVRVIGSTQSFRAMMERSKTQPFLIQFVRMKSQQSAQQSNPFTKAHTTVYGATSTNNITATTYKDGYQFDPLTVDVPLEQVIDGDRGLRFTVNAGEEISLTLFISMYSNPTNELQGKLSLRGNTNNLIKTIAATNSNARKLGPGATLPSSMPPAVAKYLGR